MATTADEHPIKPIALTTIAMTAFAANSLLCRQALGQSEIDAAGFTTVRLISGAIMLALIMILRKRSRVTTEGDWAGGFYLFLYAACFSFSYLWLGAATGALILFGTVQLTMIGVGLARGKRMAPLAWFGVTMASAGLAYLMLPGASAPSVEGALLMAVSGVAWGMYSLHGSRAKDAAAATTGNFIRAVPFALVLMFFSLPQWHASTYGLLLAVASGALASGLGYVIWYAALKYLAPAHAAAIQLSVPVIAAFGGVVILSEPLTFRLSVASVIILGGIGLVITARSKARV